MIGAIINKLSSGAIERLIFLIIITGSGLTGFAIYKGCDIDVSFKQGFKISGCTGVMVAFNTDDSGPGITSAGTMFAGLDSEDTSYESTASSPVLTGIPAPVAAVMAPPPHAPDDVDLIPPDILFADTPTTASTAAPVLKPLSELMAERKNSASMMHNKVSALIKGQSYQTAKTTVKQTLSSTFFLSAESIAACGMNTDIATVQTILKEATASGDVCACTEPAGLYRIKRAAYTSGVTTPKNISDCAKQQAVLCIRHICPSVSDIR